MIGEKVKKLLITDEDYDNLRLISYLIVILDHHNKKYKYSIKRVIDQCFKMVGDLKPFCKFDLHIRDTATFLLRITLSYRNREQILEKPILYSHSMVHEEKNKILGIPLMEFGSREAVELAYKLEESLRTGKQSIKFIDILHQHLEDSFSMEDDTENEYLMEFGDD